jgi:methylmalonyl-CoA mutase
VLAALAAGWISKRIHIGALETQARIDSGEQPVLGVNVLPQADHELSRPSCQRDSQSLRTRQSLRLMRLRADRDRARVAAALEAISACARSGEGNLLAATIEAIRARATVGECTKALERVWPRYQQPPSFAGGLYGHVRRDERWQSLCQRLAAWRARHGRYPRLLLAKLGQDGHDRGVRVLAAAMSDAGFAVHLGPLFQSPQELVAQLVDQPVDLLGISTLAGAHSELLPELLRGLGRHGIRVPVVTGGVIPAYDVACLRVAGVAAHFGPGSDITAIGESLLALLPDVRR